MRILVTLLLDTLPMLGNVLLLCFFVFFIFGIVGVQLWAGLLRNRCFLDSTFVRCASPTHDPKMLSLDSALQAFSFCWPHPLRARHSKTVLPPYPSMSPPPKCSIPEYP